jgi:hypothetical protein
MRFQLLAALILACLALSASAEKLFPVDTSNQAPGFKEFKQQMRQALKTRDADFFRRITKDSKLGFGGARNLDEMFNLTEDRFWHDMALMLDLGGVWEESESSIYYPYVTHVFPDGYHPMETAAITGEGVNVRQEPSVKSHVVDNLSWDIVSVGDDTMDNWTEVTTPSGKQGYVHGDFIYRAVGLRMCLSRGENGWKIDYLVMGD